MTWLPQLWYSTDATIVIGGIIINFLTCDWGSLEFPLPDSLCLFLSFFISWFFTGLDGTQRPIKNLMGRQTDLGSVMTGYQQTVEKIDTTARLLCATQQFLTPSPDPLNLEQTIFLITVSYTGFMTLVLDLLVDFNATAVHTLSVFVFLKRDIASTDFSCFYPRCFCGGLLIF